MSLVLDSGASGFVGFHVVDELLRQGYSLRGAVRSHNVPRISKSYQSFGDSHLGLLTAVKGVDAIIHVVSPLPNTATPQVILDSSGTTRILDAALAAGVKQLIITASIASLIASADLWKESTITGISYDPQTVEDALQPGASSFLVYAVSKDLADRAVRDFKHAHRSRRDLFTRRTSTGQVYNAPATGANHRRRGGPPAWVRSPALRAPPLHVDMRDVARAHVLALKLPPSADEPKRFIVSSSRFTWKEAIEFIAQARPERKGRLLVRTSSPAVRHT